MLVQVTAEHIRTGVKSSPSGCAVWNAVSGLFVDSNVLVSPQEIQVHKADGVVDLYPHPANVRQAITAFDEGCEIEPFEFELAYA